MLDSGACQHLFLDDEDYHKMICYDYAADGEAKVTISERIVSGEQFFKDEADKPMQEVIVLDDDDEQEEISLDENYQMSDDESDEWMPRVISLEDVQQIPPRPPEFILTHHLLCTCDECIEKDLGYFAMIDDQDAKVADEVGFVAVQHSAGSQVS